MADVRLTGAGRLDLCDRLDTAKHLASALYMAVQAVEVDHRAPLAELAALVEDKLHSLSQELKTAVTDDEAD